MLNIRPKQWIRERRMVTRLPLWRWIAQLVALVVSRIVASSEWTTHPRVDRRRFPPAMPTTGQATPWLARRAAIQLK